MNLKKSTYPLLILVFLLSACSNSDDPNPEPTEVGQWNIDQLVTTTTVLEAGRQRAAFNNIFDEFTRGTLSINEDESGSLDFSCECFEPNDIMLDFEWQRLGDNAFEIRANPDWEFSGILINANRLRLLWNEREVSQSAFGVTWERIKEHQLDLVKD